MPAADENGRRPPGSQAGHCPHAPVPGTYRAHGEFRGGSEQPPDPADYPVTAKCRHCRRRVRCGTPGGLWQAEEEYAGVDIPPFRKPFDGDPDEQDGMFRVVHRVGEQISGGYYMSEEI